MKKNKKKYLVAASALGLLALGAGTFAWFVSEDQATNHFEGQLGANDIQVDETFVPPTDWKPGGEVNKDVAISNTSEYNTLIRVSFEESLSLLKDTREIHTANGTDFTIGKDVTLTEAPANPMVVPSTKNYEEDGFVDVTEQVTNAPDDITLAEKKYEFTMYAKHSATVPVKITYVTQWKNADGNAKGYLANTASVISYDDVAKTYTLSDDAKPELTLIDKTYNKALTVKWDKEAVDMSPVTEKFNVFNSIVEAKSEPVIHNIQLIFDKEEITKDVKADKWFYNASDAYFYYVGVVAGNGQTPQLLDAVKLNEKADNKYSLLKYDLTVKAQGLQAVTGAAKDQWKIENEALNNALEEAIAKAPSETPGEPDPEA